MKNNHYSRKKRQLSNLIEELQLKMDIPGQTAGITHQIKLRIKFLLKELSGYVSKQQLKRMLGSFAIVFGFAATSNAQVFTAPVQNPFGLVPAVSDIQFPEMADLDNDGDLDILVGQYYGSFQYYENTGSATWPIFIAPITNPFGIVSSLLDIPTLADLDNDGDLDLLTGQYYGMMSYQENTGTANAPSFAAPVALPFGLVATYGLAIPDFADLDNDGDLDLVVGAYYGNFEFYLNTGSISNPVFFGPATNPFGLTQTYQFAFPAAGDLDGDGDIDLMASEYYGNFQYFENIDNTGSIDENEIAGSIDPNPFNDVVNFNFDQDVVYAEFVNLAGQVILTIENPAENVDVSSLEQGMYIVNCAHENDRKSTYKLQKI